MPTADSFTALGKGNGFPFCLDKIDVSEYDYWVTLGGFKKTDSGSPSQAQIDLSLRNAMKLWWNTAGLDVTISASLDSGIPGSISSEIIDPVFEIIGEPKTRVCEHDIDESFFDEDELEFGSSGVIARTRVEASYLVGESYFVRMYNGSTDDEVNFVGLGIDSSLFSAFGNADQRIQCWLSLLAFGEDTQDLFDGDEYHALCLASFVDEPTSNLWDFVYDDMQGIHFVSAGATNELSFSVDVDFSGFDFYTYT